MYTPSTFYMKSTVPCFLLSFLLCFFFYRHPRKGFGSADWNTVYAIYLSLCTQSADPNPYLGTACSYLYLSWHKISLAIEPRFFSSMKNKHIFWLPCPCVIRCALRATNPLYQYYNYIHQNLTHNFLSPDYEKRRRE